MNPEIVLLVVQNLIEQRPLGKDQQFILCIVKDKLVLLNGRPPKEHDKLIAVISEWQATHGLSNEQWNNIANKIVSYYTKEKICQKDLIP